jgi:choline dehydrogenase
MTATDAIDVLIVGGGSAGAVVANALSKDRDRSVLLLEAGPDLGQVVPATFRDGWRLPEIPDWGYIPEPETAGTTPRIRRGRVLGGTSWLTRFALRGASADFDAWAMRGNPGWSFADVLPVFRRIEADAEFGDRPWHGDAGPLPLTRYLTLAPTDPCSGPRGLRPAGVSGDRRPQRARCRRRGSDAVQLAQRRSCHRP